MNSNPASFVPTVDFIDSHARAPGSQACTCEGNAWREGHVIVLPREEGELPDRCVVCNGPADLYRHTMTLEVRPWWVTASFLLGFLPFFILAKLTARTATVEVGLCDKHRARQALGPWTKRIGLALGFALFITGAYLPSLPLLFVSMLLALAAIVVGSRLTAVVRAAAIDPHNVRLRVGDAFLKSIPSRAMPQREGLRAQLPAVNE